MTMISKYPLGREIKDRVFEIFLKTLADLKTSSEIKEFLDQFLTPTEKIMLSKRLSIAFLLAKDYDARAISGILKVSTKTVSSINVWMKHDQGGLYKTIKKILQKEENKEFWNELFYKIGKATIPLTVGNWSEKRREIEKERFESRKPF